MTRLVLAATLCANYGIYGPAFELLENQPRTPGSEEYLDSEKYQIRHRDLSQPHSLEAFITRVNRIRRDNPALHENWNLRFCPVDNDALICYYKATDDGSQHRAHAPSTSIRTTSSPAGWICRSRDLGIDHDSALPGPRPAHRPALPLARRAQLPAAGSRRVRRRTSSWSRKQVRSERDFDYFLDGGLTCRSIRDQRSQPSRHAR